MGVAEESLVLILVTHAAALSCWELDRCGLLTYDNTAMYEK